MPGMCTSLSLWNLPWVCTKCQTLWKALSMENLPTSSSKDLWDPTACRQGVLPPRCPALPASGCVELASGWGHLQQLWYPPVHSLGMSEINREGRNARKYSELCNSRNSIPDTYIFPNFGDLALKPYHQVSFLTCNKDNAASMSCISIGISVSTGLLRFVLCCCYLGAFTFQVKLEKQPM